MTSRPVVFVLLQDKNVFQITHKIIVTNTIKAAPGTIRGDFAIDASKTIIHVSDSEKSAKIEIERFFNSKKI
ncbi:hypothetical protein NRIC_25620 [Enterococcus florum]|uniref:nucleoside-diphosphate kinase n=1 Tax=Enterococcus florum TaxID=2480627 RepID=A0A4P5PED4_9ENTE|nr:hypothetical protein NRIC_25620 [Enterococcus florum]